MKDLDEFKDITEEEDRQSAFEKFVRRQKEKLREAESSDVGSTRSNDRKYSRSHREKEDMEVDEPRKRRDEDKRSSGREREKEKDRRDGHRDRERDGERREHRSSRRDERDREYERDRKDRKHQGESEANGREKKVN